MRVVALVLAAGRSTRMGAANKLTTLFEGKPTICHVVDTVLGASVDEILVVTGHDEVEVRDALQDHPVRFVRNPDFLSGMASSIVRGLAAVAGIERPEVSAILICLGDMPAVSPATIDALVRSFESSKQRAAIVAPVHGGRRGHPVLFGSSHFEALRRLSGDRGAREILVAARDHVIEVECDDVGIHQDIDRPEDFARMSNRSTCD